MSRYLSCRGDEKYITRAAWRNHNFFFGRNIFHFSAITATVRKLHHKYFNLASWFKEELIRKGFKRDHYVFLSELYLYGVLRHIDTGVKMMINEKQKLGTMSKINLTKGRG